jgi:hypothetical protein
MSGPSLQKTPGIRWIWRMEEEREVLDKVMMK